MADQYQLRTDLLARHADGSLDVERLLQAPIEMWEELSIPFLMSGVGAAIDEVAPGVVRSYRKTHEEPRTSADRLAYIQGLLDAVEAAEIDLSGREVRPLPPEEEEEIFYVIPND